jgi:hypothetical protein
MMSTDRDLEVLEAENERLRAHIAELQAKALAPVAAVTAMSKADTQPLVPLARRVLGRGIGVIIFLAGIGIGFGIAMRNPEFRRGIQDGWQESTQEAQTPPPAR